MANRFNTLRQWGHDKTCRRPRLCAGAPNPAKCPRCLKFEAEFRAWCAGPGRASHQRHMPASRVALWAWRWVREGLGLRVLRFVSFDQRESFVKQTNVLAWMERPQIDAGSAGSGRPPAAGWAAGGEHACVSW